MVRSVLEAHPEEVDAYLDGKEGLLNWFFGQVMRTTGGKANTSMIREELLHQLSELGRG
jgi:Asp-tRNA(Asn)/Glu-tRNA(Gln) amidotransferase B subunit